VRIELRERISRMDTITIDFVSSEPDGSLWRMVLVEEGPWAESEVIANLERLQNRLYRCIDAAIDGGLAEKYPKSAGKAVVVQLDCYNLPELQIRSFFEHFSAGVFELPDYKDALSESEYVRSVSFELNCKRIGRNT
jgi:hypothetical protein